MLGATHACANPLTAQYGTTHGVAIAVMLPHVVRWNAEVGRRPLRGAAARGRATRAPATGSTDAGPRRRAAADARPTLGASRADIPALAADAATQWTGTFNPRPFDAAAALALYERASDQPAGSREPEMPRKPRILYYSGRSSFVGSGSHKLAMKPMT